MNAMSANATNFGEFLQKKREEKRITLRKMADLLGFSAPFLSDVEKDRRNPPDLPKLEQIAEILGLSYEEKETMFNLAGKKRDSVAPDLPEYIMSRDYVAAALRTARDLDAGEEEWLQFVNELKQRKG
jgi:transcriptional regulator with XRE-family HTH domain